MIENIVFDMGNVLLRFDGFGYAEAFTETPEDRDLFMEEIFRSVEWIQRDRGSITDEEAVESISKRIPERLHPNLRRLFAEWYRNIPNIPEMEELAARLKKNGYRLYLLSNTDKMYHVFRENISALKYFDGEFISADWHMMKPSEMFYHTFCTHFSLKPETCFFIDDIPLNVEGARHIGMKGTVFLGNMEKLAKALEEAGVRI